MSAELLDQPRGIIVDWEHHWAVYDEKTYQSALGYILPGSVVIDIGCGDMRLARRMAKIARKVYAVEQNPDVFMVGLRSSGPLPDNLIPLCADACIMDFPSDVDTAVLLMRHCTHFRLFADKLRSIGCIHLITNARWGMDIECVSLQAQGLSFEQVELGWYACCCGSAGFKSGPADKVSLELDAITFEVFNCPDCLKQ